MVTFVANVAVDVDTLSPDLGVRVDANAVWFSAGPVFTAASSDGFLKVAGIGGNFTNNGGKPGTGAIEGDDHSLFGHDRNDHLDGGAHDDESMCVWWGG